MPTARLLSTRQGDPLYVTSAREAVTRESSDAAPLSGHLFVVHDR